MARSRNIKPAFFANEELAELPFEARLLFIGLWTLADREGRLEDRPKRIKMAVFPADNIDVEPSLDGLNRGGLIERYTVDGVSVIQIPKFVQHQRPHGAEKDSELPCIDGLYIQHERGRTGLVTNAEKYTSYTKQQLTEKKHCAETVSAQVKTVSAQVKTVSAQVKTVSAQVKTVSAQVKTVIAPYQHALNPECGILNAESLILNPECGMLHPEVNTIPHQQAGAPATFELVVPEQSPAKAKTAKPLDPDEQQGCKDAWAAYSQAYKNRYAVAPVRNAAVNAKVKQFVKRIGKDEAPGVCRFYIEAVNDAFIVKQMHDFGLLLKGCEGYRTQWITGKAVTGESAKRVEKSQDQGDQMDEIRALIKQHRGTAVWCKTI